MIMHVAFFLVSHSISFGNITSAMSYQYSGSQSIEVLWQKFEKLVPKKALSSISYLLIAVRNNCYQVDGENSLALTKKKSGCYKTQAALFFYLLSPFKHSFILQFLIPIFFSDIQLKKLVR